MLTELRLDKFQGFGQPVTIPLKPLTLIYGPNAAGKSSIFRSILLAKQSLPKESFGFLRYSGFDGFVFEGEQISLASFANVVHKHDTDSSMTVGISLQIGPQRRIQRSSQRNLFLGVSLDWVITNTSPFSEVKVSFHPKDGQQAFFIKFSRKDNRLFVSEISGGSELLDILENYVTRRQLREGNSNLNIEEDDDQNYRSSFDTFSVEDFRGLKFPILGNLPRISASNNFGANYLEGPKQRQLQILNDLIQLARTGLMQKLSEVVHIKPLREIDHRFIYEGEGFTSETGTQSAEVNPAHEVISEWISNLTEGRYQFKSINFVAEEMRYLGKMKSQMLIDTLTGTPVSFRDVGVGLSQIKPILEVLAQGDEKGDTILLIEQPELHLHPKMQADLASLFAELAVSRPGTQIVAETHSEAMLLRIQKNLRDGKLSPKDVQILYVDKSSHTENPGNSVMALDLDESSDYDFELPLSFAELRFKDLI